MSHTPHELAEEFPDKREAISILKEENAHFARLAEEYHVLNRRIHRAETNVEPLMDLDELTLRKERMQLKDQIARLLN